ncbi:MAG: stage III sporulation protein AD [Lachnospiraceae bacterium]|jgi:stage III sporulation protein AD|nr:stage III sporulation protein AD [Lachnospiraceae bacterium]
MTVITVAVAGIVAVMLAVQLKGVKGEYSTYLAAAAGCFIFFYGMARLETILDSIRRIQEMVRINRVYLTTLLKITGVTYIAEFASGICKDAGYGSIANQIEIFGKLSILAMSMPIVLALLEALQGLLA